MSGGAPAIDANGNLFLATGNGAFDADSNTPPNTDFGDSVLRLSPASNLAVTDWFTPFDTDRTRRIRVPYMTVWRLASALTSSVNVARPLDVGATDAEEQPSRTCLKHSFLSERKAKVSAFGC